MFNIHVNIDNPLTVFLMFMLFAAGLVVRPALKTEQIRVTPAKCVAVSIAIGISMYNGNFLLMLLFLWPLSFIWFPEYWGRFTGFLRGPYIDQPSPPILISLLGWFFLVVFPLLIVWLQTRG